MQIVHERCCGLGVHKKTVVACVLVTEAGGGARRRVRTFGTMTADRLALGDWLDGFGVAESAMASTGVSWRPICNLLAREDRRITLVNPQHMRAVPGRKTDVKDSDWLADLLRHGLVKPSCIPPVAIRDLRELTRYRKTLVQQRTREANRLHQLLEGANVKLAAVASASLGKSGRDMLDALLGGEQDPGVLAELARGRLREKLPALRLALEGRATPVHRTLLAQILAHSDFLDGAIGQPHDASDQRLGPFAEAVALFQAIPGVSAKAAAVIVAEIGTDMGRFATHQHLASWAGRCPGNKQRGGKRLSGTTTHGNAWLRGLLSECAWARARGKTGDLAAQFRRLARRRGAYQALVAVAHSLLVIIDHVRRDRRPYADLGGDYFDRLDAERVERHHVRRLNALGYSVTLTALPSPDPAPA